MNLQLARISPSCPTGSLMLPPSKSGAHRALICAALSQTPCLVSPIDWSEDIVATCEVLQALGFGIEKRENAVFSRGATGYKRPKKPVIADCGESGSTLRFMLPLCAALGIEATFTGRGRLGSRPMDTLIRLLSGHGVTIKGETLPLSVSGQLKSGLYTLPGNISSQYITGLLFSLPLLAGESRIQLATPLESAGYVEMTMETLESADIHIEPMGDSWRIPGGQKYHADLLTVEGDWSQAAFFGIMGAIGGPIVLSGLRSDSLQGDRALVGLLAEFGADVFQTPDTLTISKGPLRGIRIDAGQIPDLVPALAVLGAFAEGETTIYNAARLRLKESDRLTAICDGIVALGGMAHELPDGLVIEGKGLLDGRASGAGDHRIVMALAAGACFAKGPCEIEDAQSIAKSYPAFFDDYKQVGGIADVIDLD